MIQKYNIILAEKDSFHLVVIVSGLVMLAGTRIIHNMFVGLGIEY